MHNHKIQEDYAKFLNSGVDVWSVKTDAFVIRQEHASKAKKAITLQNEGKYLNDYTRIYNETLHNMENEWDTESIAKQITQKNPCIIRSKYAGGGKSHIAKNFQQVRL